MLVTGILTIIKRRGECMESYEKERLDEWAKNQQFDKIIHYVDLLKEPSYEHLGRKVSALNNSRRYYEAIALLEELREHGQEDALWHYRYGYSLMCIEEYEHAQDHLLECITLNETDGDAWFLLCELYEHFLPNKEKLEWARGHLKNKTVLAQPLEQKEFVKGQIFNRRYKVLEEFDVYQESLYDKLTPHYDKYIHALESFVSSYEDIPKLTFALAKTILSAHETYTHDIIGICTTEVAYILSWFGVSDALIEHSIDLFLYTLTIPQSQSTVTADDYFVLANYVYHQQYDDIIAFIDHLPPDKRHYAYIEFAIRAYIYLHRFDDAKAYLLHYQQEAKQNAMWYYLYGLVASNLADFTTAKHTLFRAVELHPRFEDAWLLLEKVFLNGLHDIENANWAREQRELNCPDFNVNTNFDHDEDEEY